MSRWICSAGVRVALGHELRDCLEQRRAGGDLVALERAPDQPVLERELPLVFDGGQQRSDAGLGDVVVAEVQVVQ